MLESLSAPTLICAALLLVLVGLRHWPGITLGVTLGAPLFFEVTSDGIGYGRSVLEPREGPVLPVSLFCAPLFSALAWDGVRGFVSGARANRRVAIAVCGFVVWALLAFIWAIATGAPDTFVLMQVVVPTWFFAVGGSLSERRQFDGFVFGLIGVATMTAVMLALSGAVLGQPAGVTDTRLGDRLLGGFVVFQAWDYVPALLAFCAIVAFSAAEDARWRPVLAAAAAVLVVVVAALYSRGAILMLMVGGVAVVAARPATSLRARITVVGSVALAAVVILGAATVAGAASARRLLNTFSVEAVAADPSNQTRADATRRALDEIRTNPLFGRAMQPSEVDPVTGRRLTVNTHNQYLDYAVRGGIPLSLMFIVAAFIVVRTFWHATRSRPDYVVLRGVTIGLTTFLLLSNVTQVNFVQPLTAFSLWLVFGVAARRTAF